MRDAAQRRKGSCGAPLLQDGMDGLVSLPLISPDLCSEAVCAKACAVLLLLLS